MTPNQLPTDGMAILGTVDPVSQGVGTVSTPWVSVQNFHSFLALIDAGVFGAAATINAQVQQAQNNAGLNAKNITSPQGITKQITQLVAAGGNNRQAMINLRAQDLDTTNGFSFIQLQVTVGAAATLVSAALLGFYPRFEPPVDPLANPAINLGAASVAQIVL